MPTAALSSSRALTASVEPSPDSATAMPNVSPAPVFDAFTYACWLHAAPLRVNT
jgi:hypothetical protein